MACFVHDASSRYSSGRCGRSDGSTITSQALPSQNIQSGTLRLLVEPGYVGQIGYGPDSAHIPWKNAFPIRKGKLLNIRKLEQGLEQMKRVSSQDVTMELKPGIESHTTDVVLQIKRTDKPIHALISLDNSGLKDTGTLQWNFNVSADQVFRANDTLSFGFNKDGAQEGYEKGTRGHSVSYVIPSGNDTFSFQYYRYTYHQTVPSIPFIFLSSSVTKQERLNWNHVFYRDKQVKRSWNVGVQRRTSHSFINDQEVAVQAMNTTDLLVGFDERRYIKTTPYIRLLAISEVWAGLVRKRTTRTVIEIFQPLVTINSCWMWIMCNLEPGATVRHGS